MADPYQILQSRLRRGTGNRRVNNQPRRIEGNPQPLDRDLAQPGSGQDFIHNGPGQYNRNFTFNAPYLLGNEEADYLHQRTGVSPVSRHGNDYSPGFQASNFNQGLVKGWNDQQLAYASPLLRKHSSGPYQGVGPNNYEKSDEQIQEEVNERLFQHGQIDARGIQVQVEDGIVTLYGSVPNRHTRHQAEDMVQDVPGVKQVHDHLQVGEKYDH